MNWFVWWQHREQFFIFGVILAIFTVFTVLTGNHYWHEYQQLLNTCKQNPANPSCSDLDNSLGQNYGAILRVIYVTAIGMPLVLGLFLGSPLFSKEYEDGTNKLVWTQSVSRRKWLTTKLIWIIVFAALYGLVISLLASWWSRTTNAIDHSRFDTGQFDVQGIMPFTYAIFFTAIGFTMSALFRKTLIALAVTLCLFIAFQASVGEWIRPHYMKPVTVTSIMGPNEIESKIPQGAWTLTRSIVDKDGNSFNSFSPSTMPPVCQALLQQSPSNNGGNAIRVKIVPGNGDPIDACLNNAGFHQIAKYQPSYRYWDFQRIETGIYLAMTAIVITATFWLVLRRDA